ISSCLSQIDDDPVKRRFHGGKSTLRFCMSWSGCASVKLRDADVFTAMRLPGFLVLLVLIPCLTPLRGADAPANAEIEFLINYVEHANVRFIRNGKEYSAKEAADHLRDKLSQAGGRVKTA